MKRNYYRADMNAPPKKIDVETQKEISNRYDKGYSLKSIIAFVAAKECINNFVKIKNATKEWILCSERLPKENGTYLCTLDGELVGQEGPFTGIADLKTANGTKKTAL